ncbi:MAG: hypothetical protein WD750_12660 [Gammaproteobacteria bacterium]
MALSPQQAGDGGDGMEARIARLESDVAHIRTDIAEIKVDTKDFRKEIREDFRILWGALFFITLGLAGLMTKGFGWL